MIPEQDPEAWIAAFGAMGGGAVHLEDDAPILRLTLDHPSASNALTGRMITQLGAVIGALERQCADPSWGGVGLIVQGAGGRAFCAGADLRMVRQHLDTPLLAEHMCRLMQDLTERLSRLPLVSVAAIEGAAIGGGAELAMACDLRVLAKDAQIRFVQARMGLSPGWGGGARLVRRVGRERALRLLGAAESMAGEQALALGLVDALAAPGETALEAARRLGPFCAHAPAAQRAAKAVVALASGIPEAAYAAERAIFTALWGGPAHRAAMAGR